MDLRAHKKHQHELKRLKKRRALYAMSRGHGKRGAFTTRPK